MQRRSHALSREYRHVEAARLDWSFTQASSFKLHERKKKRQVKMMLRSVLGTEVQLNRDSSQIVLNANDFKPKPCYKSRHMVTKALIWGVEDGGVVTSTLSFKWVTLVGYFQKGGGEWMSEGESEKKKRENARLWPWTKINIARMREL